MIKEINKENNKYLPTKTLVVISLLTGLSIILTRVFSVTVPLAGLPALRIGFGSIPIIISGILFGPLAGALTGAVADVLGFMINSLGGAYFPGFTISAALAGVIPGIVYKYADNKTINFNILNTLSILAIVSSVVNLLFVNNVISFSNNTLYLYDNKMPIYIIFISMILVLAFIFIPIILSKKYNSEKSSYSLEKILFVVTLQYIITSIGLNTLWLSIMFNKGFLVFLPGRILAGLVIIPLHSVILFTLSKFFKYIK